MTAPGPPAQPGQEVPPPGALGRAVPHSGAGWELGGLTLGLDFRKMLPSNCSF